MLAYSRARQPDRLCRLAGAEDVADSCSPTRALLLRCGAPQRATAAPRASVLLALAEARGRAVSLADGPTVILPRARCCAPSAVATRLVGRAGALLSRAFRSHPLTRLRVFYSSFSVVAFVWAKYVRDAWPPGQCLAFFQANVYSGLEAPLAFLGINKLQNS